MGFLTRGYLSKKTFAEPQLESHHGTRRSSKRQPPSLYRCSGLSERNRSIIINIGSPANDDRPIDRGYHAKTQTSSNATSTELFSIFVVNVQIHRHVEKRKYDGQLGSRRGDTSPSEGTDQAVRVTSVVTGRPRRLEPHGLPSIHSYGANANSTHRL